MGSLRERQPGLEAPWGRGVVEAPWLDTLGTQEGRRRRAIAIELGEARQA